MKLRSLHTATLCVLLLTVAATAQQKKTGILQGDDLKKVVPASYFFDDQAADVQMRNSAAIRTSDNKIVAAGLVDTSGYSTAIAAKYQGFFIASKKVSVEGKTLSPGQYGFGFTDDGKFRIMDAGANDVFLVDAHKDDKLQRAVPLRIVAEGSDFRLYAGKKYVTLKIQ